MRFLVYGSSHRVSGWHSHRMLWGVTEHRNLIIRRNVTLTEASASQMAAHEPGLAWEDVFLLL